MIDRSQEPPASSVDASAIPSFTELINSIIRNPLETATSAQKQNIDDLKEEIDGHKSDMDAGFDRLQQLTALLQEAMQVRTDELSSKTSELRVAIAEVARVGEATALEAARSIRRQWVVTIAVLVVVVLAGIFIDPHVGT